VHRERRPVPQRKISARRFGTQTALGAFRRPPRVRAETGWMVESARSSVAPPQLRIGIQLTWVYSATERIY
jgi:hypothetical protein